MIKTSALNTIEVQRKVSAVLRAALYHVDTLLLRNGVICFPFQRIAAECCGVAPLVVVRPDGRDNGKLS
jgi:hypothetical protein